MIRDHSWKLCFKELRYSKELSFGLQCTDIDTSDYRHCGTCKSHVLEACFVSSFGSMWPENVL